MVLFFRSVCGFFLGDVYFITLLSFFFFFNYIHFKKFHTLYASQMVWGDRKRRREREARRTKATQTGGPSFLASQIQFSYWVSPCSFVKAPPIILLVQAWGNINSSSSDLVVLESQPWYVALCTFIFNPSTTPCQVKLASFLSCRCHLPSPTFTQSIDKPAVIWL